MSLAKPLLAAVALLLSLPAAADGHLFETKDFRGNVPGVTLRGVNAGGQPWVFDSIQARLFAPDDGETLARLRVKVKGLVFAPGTPLAGTRGGVTHYAATLSCFTGADTDPANHVLVTTDGFPTNLDGDADIDDEVAVPAVCYAPVLFVRSFNPTTGAAGNWFAVTGF